MRDLLLIVVAYSEYYAGPLKYENLRDRLYDLGLRDYLVNDVNEWVALPGNVYGTWVQGDEPDAVLAEWNQKLRTLFGSGKPPGAFFVSVGADAVWQTQVFE